jgi:hypothetical protein
MRKKRETENWFQRRAVSGNSAAFLRSGNRGRFSEAIP